MNINKLREFAYNQHDIVCNQKYNKTLPYSFHLNMVELQPFKFKHLLTDEEFYIVCCICICHDLIEDARLTYNDIIALKLSYDPGSSKTVIDISKKVADGVFACTELRGRDRNERHGAEFFELLRNERLGRFAKLCDNIANVHFGILTNSSMVKKYAKEYNHLHDELYTEEFDEMFVYLKKLFTL